MSESKEAEAKPKKPLEIFFENAGVGDIMKAIQLNKDLLEEYEVNSYSLDSNVFIQNICIHVAFLDKDQIRSAVAYFIENQKKMSVGFTRQISLKIADLEFARTYCSNL